MRAARIGRFLALFALVPAASAIAQAPVPRPATDLSSAEVQDAVKIGLQALTPGVTLSDRVISLAELGAYNVAVAVVVRPAVPDRTAINHEKITEVYYVIKGSGTQTTGTLVDGAPISPSKTVGPSNRSPAPLQNMKSRRLGPGDIQVIPPGLGHAWSAIDEGGVQYLVFRIDPDKVVGVSE